MALDAHAEGDSMTDDNERYVRDRWNLVHRCDGSYRGYLGGVVLIQDTHGLLHFETWAAARAFTEARLEQIRQVEEEIAYVRRWHRGPHPVWTRILAREQATLAELRIGMKVTA